MVVGEHVIVYKTVSRQNLRALSAVFAWTFHVFETLFSALYITCYLTVYIYIIVCSIYPETDLASLDPSSSTYIDQLVTVLF